MSNNSFAPSDVPPWFSTLESLETLIMDRTQIQGELPLHFFSLPLLKTVVLRNNRLNGTLNIKSRSNKLQLIDLQNNTIDAVTPGVFDGVQLLLLGNPICLESVKIQYPYCIAQPLNNSYSTPPCNSLPFQCSSPQVSSPTCKCAYPYTGNLYFRGNFSYIQNVSDYIILEQSIMHTFQTSQLPVDSISVRAPTKNLDGHPAWGLHLQIFPSSQDHFNRTGIIAIGSELNNQLFEGLSSFFISDSYKYFEEGVSKSSSTGIIIWVAVGCSVLVILLLLAGVYSFHQKKRDEIASRRSNPFAPWGWNKNSGDALNLKHAEHFSFEALKKCTDNFSEINDIGYGGYGKVYKGILPSGQLVAIKRARQRSIEGSLEFRTEIELLSRVHHKNLVGLVGFCFEKGEQLLVYEYMPNGTLQDSLSGKSGIRLDWARRVQIAIGAAKGLQYLHDLVNPPIIHRDIKSNNILLDEYLNAKVADFGLSKLAGEPEKGYVTTQVKGTMGYLDPEYYMTLQLTEKSDVYSFGVLLLELIMARKPIEKGMYIVREVEQTIDRTKELYNLHGILDPLVRSSWPPRSLEKFVDLALRCVAEGVRRPTMSEVVKEIENIMEVAGVNPNVDSGSTSASHEGAAKNDSHPYSNETLFSHSGKF